MIARVFAGGSEGLTRDDVLDNITLTWLTNTALSGARLYWENKGYSQLFPRSRPNGRHQCLVQFAIVFGLAFIAAGRFRHPASHWSARGKPVMSTPPIRAQDITEATLRSATVKVGPTK